MREGLKLKVDEEISFIEVERAGKSVVIGIFHYEDKHKQTVFIDEYVVTAERGCGIGSNGYFLLRDYFRKKGVKSIRLKASRGLEDGPWDNQHPYNFWVNMCGFMPREEFVEDDLTQERADVCV